MRTSRTDRLVGKAEQLEASLNAVRGPANVAVVLMGSMGLGKTALLDAMAEELAEEMNSLRIHASASLSQVPYGVLAPYIADLPVEDAASPAVLYRAFWGYFEKRRGAGQKQLLLLVDDAQDLDEATAGLIAELGAVGWAKLVLACRPKPGLPEPLLQLWFEGLAVRYDIRPLTRGECREFLRDELGQKVMPSTSDLLWSAAAGNPLLISCLVEDAKANGTLQCRNGVWLLTKGLDAEGKRLRDVVHNIMLRRSKDERDALNLIALAEPAPRSITESLVGEETVQQLLDAELIEVAGTRGNSLSLALPVYGAALRGIISPSRSLELRHRVASGPGWEPDGARTSELMRMAAWSLECGLPVEEDVLLRVAYAAARRHEHQLAQETAASVQAPPLRSQARAVLARTYLDRSAYSRAESILKEDFRKGADPDALKSGGLLWVAVRAALGDSPEQILEQWEILTEHFDQGDRNPEGEAVRLMAFALAGHEVGERREPGEPAGSSGAVADVFRRLLDVERLESQGKYLLALKAVSEALVKSRELHEELYPVECLVASRLVAAATLAGDWESAEDIPAFYAMNEGERLVTFGGTLYAAQGLELFFQGRSLQALQVLSEALEGLDVADPLQVAPLAAAVCFAAAADSGEHDRAAASLERYGNGAEPVLASSRALAQLCLAFGEERLHRDGRGLAKISALGAGYRESGDIGLHFEALCFALRLGDKASIERLSEMGGAVDGRRAHTLIAYSQALSSGSGSQLMDAAKECEDAGLTGFAAEAFAEAARAYSATKDLLRERVAAAQRERCVELLGAESHSRTAAGEADDLALLTRRQKDIVELAVHGLSDREIAAKLHVSVRTVEGHLYRTYAKLGIKGREELQERWQE